MQLAPDVSRALLRAIVSAIPAVGQKRVSENLSGVLVERDPIGFTVTATDGRILYRERVYAVDAKAKLLRVLVDAATHVKELRKMLRVDRSDSCVRVNVVEATSPHLPWLNVRIEGKIVCDSIPLKPVSGTYPRVALVVDPAPAPVPAFGISGELLTRVVAVFGKVGLRCECASRAIVFRPLVAEGRDRFAVVMPMTLPEPFLSGRLSGPPAKK